jgi:DNA-binding SARP family transcriptional activator
VEFRILGPVEAWTDGRRLPLGGPMQRALLAILLLNRGHVVPVERLVDDLWGGQVPEGAGSRLWVHVARLRKALEPSRTKGAASGPLVTLRGGYLLQIEPDELDLERFERLAAHGRRALVAGAAEEAGSVLRQALALWSGPALADLASEPFALGHVVRLEERRLAILEDRIDADLAAGRHRDLAGELEALVRAQPVRERLRGQLMLALYRAGRQADALEVYRQTRQYLADELGIEPDAALEQLHKAILLHDPALALVSPPATSPQPGSRHGAPGSPPDGHALPLLSPASPAAPVPMETRKTVTVAAIAIAASRAGGQIDPESLRHLEERYLTPVGVALTAYGATVQQLTAESVIAVFGVPTVHENDAVRAVQAAVDVRSLLERVNATLEVEQGMHLSMAAGIETGEIVVRERDGDSPLLTGKAPRTAVALAHAAGHGEVLLGPATYRLVRDAVRVEAADAGPGATRSAWRLSAVRLDMPERARRLDAPMVGREREMKLLTEVFKHAVRERTCHLLTILGPAGIGKSRLVEEFLVAAGRDATVLRGRCLDYGEGITFWPIAEAIRQAMPTTVGSDDVRAGIAGLLRGDRNADRVAQQVAGLLGATEVPGALEEIPWAVRRLLELLARRGPLLLVLDDLHWAEPPLLDLVDHIADLTRGAPIVLCCIARPELLEARPGWGGGKPNATSILLEPLGNLECDELIGNLLGTSDLSSAATRRLCEVAEGNPLFLEELVGMLIDDGVLVRPDGAWVAAADLTTLPVPPTVSALLTARLDQLDAEERAVLGWASVMGRVFDQEAVIELAPEPSRSEVPSRLLALTRKELIRPDRSGLDGGDWFRFRHQLIRDAAYAVLPKLRRAELHERAAAWLETNAEPSGKVDELVAYHLEQACLYRAELGLTDRALVRRTADRLARAGQRASDEWNRRAASSFLTRARALLPPDDPTSLELLPTLVANLAYQGDRMAADELAAWAIAVTRGAGSSRLEARIRIEEQLTRLNDADAWVADQARQEFERALPVFSRDRDARGLAAAWLLAGRIELLVLRCNATYGAFRRAASYARLVGDHGRARSAFALLGWAYVVGPVPVAEAILRCDQLGRQAGDNQVMHTVIRSHVARLEAMRGEFARAWALLDDIAATFDDLGQTVGWVPWMSYREAVAFVAGMQGDFARAERSLRLGRGEVERAGASAVLSYQAAFLADLAYRRGGIYEAEELTGLSERLATADDVWSQLLWRRVLAKILARRPDRTQEALRLSAEALRLAEGTDALAEQGDTWMDRAEVLRMAGAPVETVRAAAKQALDRYARKGNLVSKAGAERVLASAAT